MEMDALVKVLGEGFFPIALAAILIFWIMKIISSYKATVDKQLEDYKKTLEEQSEDIKELVEKYHDDYARIISTIDNNTRALDDLTRLVGSIIVVGKKEKGES